MILGNRKRLRVPIPPEVMDNIRSGRDAEWSRVLGVKGTVLTPDQYAKLLRERFEGNGGGKSG